MESKSKGKRRSKKKNNDGKKLQTTKTQQRKHCCEWCGRTCGNTTLLHNHVRTHTGEKPFLCTVCHKDFRSTHQLKIHIRIHTGEKPFKCPNCSKSFAAASNLLKHRLVHTQIKKYSCNTCNKSFTQKANLQAHIRGVHMKIPYPPRIRNRKKKLADISDDRSDLQPKHDNVLKNVTDRRIIMHAKLEDDEDNAEERKPVEVSIDRRVVQPNNERCVKNDIDRIRKLVKLELEKRESLGALKHTRVVQPCNEIVVKNKTFTPRRVKQEYVVEDNIKKIKSEVNSDVGVRLIEKLKYEEEWGPDDYNEGEIEFLEDWDQFEDVILGT